jgi:hypothetical protein
MMHNDNWYYRGCKFTWRHFSGFIKDHEEFKKKSEKAVSQEYINSLVYTGFDLEPYETTFFSYIGSAVIFFIVLFTDALLFRLTTFSSGILTAIVMMSFIIPIVGLSYLSEYVKIHARYMRIHHLGICLKS